MDFGTTEIEIADYLSENINDDTVEVVPLPEDEEEVLPKFGKKRVIVAFAAEDADNDSNISFVTQDTAITFSVLLQGKKLRGEQGLYALAEKVKDILMGFVPTDLRELTYSSHKFVNNDKKVFEYVLDFKTEGTRVASTPEPPTIGGLLNTVTYNQE